MPTLLKWQYVPQHASLWQVTPEADTVPKSKSKPEPCTSSPVQFYRPETYQRCQSLGWMLRKLKQSITRQASLRLQGVALTHSQLATLITLRHSGPNSTSSSVQLARELEVDAGAFTRLLDRLEAKGLIQRERSEQDRRVVMVSLSEDGMQLTSQMHTVLSDVFNAHLSGFSHEEWLLLLSLLQRMIDNGEALEKAQAQASANPQAHNTRTP
ncbi:MarR family winged helix-turn-helix transcriptional regulator [Roseateles sp. BYS180W]|uniref:MarR family winged helix-turn-helix transcriptional regulator n=1 Tax=Roseateles rivi TaxID=3299028 RepID=A0ABW7FYD5_9BURK